LPCLTTARPQQGDWVGPLRRRVAPAGPYPFGVSSEEPWSFRKASNKLMMQLQTFGRWSAWSQSGLRWRLLDLMSAMMDAGCGRFLTKRSMVSWALSMACNASDCDVVLCFPSLRICCCTAVMPSFDRLAIFVFSRLRIRLAHAPLASSNVMAAMAASTARVQ
jgi:hypothetical protein